MFRFLIAALLVLVTAEAQAGPLRRRSSSSVSLPVSGDTSTAQGVAEIQANRRAMGHCGGNSSYEGVGMGMSPQAALNNCCNNGRPVIDQGVAQGPDGRWYACKRYAR
jgi:hypothetical protein